VTEKSIDEQAAPIHTCSNCGTLIYYDPNRGAAPSTNLCPKCGVLIPKLEGALILAFEVPNTEKEK
jgi:hypothetical protein